MMRNAATPLRIASRLCAAAVVAYGAATLYSNSNQGFRIPSDSHAARKPIFPALHSWNPTARILCDSTSEPTVCVVTEIPQGSAIYLTGHGDQSESGADPFIFKFTRGYVPQTRVSSDEPLSAMVLGHLESIPGWMLKEAHAVGLLVVMQQDTGAVLSRELVVVEHGQSLTREQAEDLMIDAAKCLETLKSEFELGTKVFVKPVYDPIAAAGALRDAKLEYQRQQARDARHAEATHHSSHRPTKEEQEEAQKQLETMPLSDIPLAKLFDELARRGISTESSSEPSHNTADAK